MRINLCCTDTFVSQHCLNCTQVGTTFEQGGGKGVAKRMWRNCFLDTSFNRISLNHDKNHRTRKVLSTTI